MPICWARPKSASVAVIYRPVKGSDGPPVTDEAIKQMIASAISGLEETRVYVIQKELKEVTYLDSVDKKSVITANASDMPSNATVLNRLLLIITIMALLVGAYGMIRPVVKRKFGSLAKTSRVLADGGSEP